MCTSWESLNPPETWGEAMGGSIRANKSGQAAPQLANVQSSCGMLDGHWCYLALCLHSCSVWLLQQKQQPQQLRRWCDVSAQLEYPARMGKGPVLPGPC
mmetsp:Transcript_15025/g.33132  ORF Transcript_15025/g.33132 Transcript_15025/m.33132 type:complete len:99 (+) Transcript_15025:6-302(+)